MKKKYWLALWGWASRWLAHIWVIEYLEEQKIEISEIAGTSMWAIIWACFAIWKTSQDMTQIMSEINFLKLIDINLKDSIVSGEKVYQKLTEIFWDLRIEETYIPLKIIATNVTTGEKEVFTSGKIVDAIRASISLPSIFKMFTYNGNTYLDGGLKCNLPVWELETKDIIAVSVVRERNLLKTHRKIWNFEFKKWFLWNTYEVLKKTISIIMANNEDLHLELAKIKGKNIILLKPETSNYEYFDFLKYEEIIKKWYDEARKKLDLTSEK